jgi:hypothetical protein
MALPNVGPPSQASVNRLLKQLRADPALVKEAATLARKDGFTFINTCFKLTEAQKEGAESKGGILGTIFGGVIASAIQTGGKVDFRLDPGLKGGMHLEITARPVAGGKAVTDAVVVIKKG